VLEHAASHARVFYAGFVAVTPPLGLALASLTLVTASKLLSPQDFAAYGWRVPFLLSVILTAIGLVFRIKLLETPLFEEAKRRGDIAKIPLVETFARHPRYMLVGTAIAAGHAVLAYTATGYIFTYLTNVTKLDPISANLAVGVAGLLQLPFYIFNAWLSDKIGRRRIYMTGLFFAMATYYPVYLWLASVKDVALVSLGVFVLILATAFTFNILGTTLAELFPTRVRYTAMSMAFNPGIGFFGGFTPLIIQAIGLWLKNPLAGVILHTYVAAAVALLTALLPLPETKDKTLD